jgi:hypothetical protein
MAVTGKINISFNRTVLTDKCQLKLSEMVDNVTFGMDTFLEELFKLDYCLMRRDYRVSHMTADKPSPS